MSRTQLKAIMFTDIVGYTAMMQLDRDQAMAAVKSYEMVLKELLIRHEGELVHTYGDGSLSVFDSASNAILCAKALQTTILGQVPLRIGIHVGEITIDGEHTFGDGINVCSRIESMGIAGAVLLSKEAQQKVQNRADLSFASMGSFQFKHVADPLEVYALTSPPLVVPKRKDLKGKFAPSTTYWPYVLGFGLLISLGIGLTWWNQRQKVPMSEEVQGKRISVLPFSDQTNDEQFTAFGGLLSDWLSTRLMDIEGTVVMRPANIEEQVQQAKQAGVSMEGFAQELQALTGVDLIVEGKYYLVDGSLLINAQILNVADNQMVKSFEVQGPQDQRMALLESIGQKILGYWAVKDVQHLTIRPPTYASFKLYQDALTLTIVDPSESIRKLALAAEADTTFLNPLFALYSMYNQEGKQAEREGVFEEMTRRKPNFTKWDQMTYNQIIEIRAQNWLQAAQMSERMFDLDPSNLGAAMRALNLYLYAGYAQRALDVWARIDPRFLPERNQEIDWSPVALAFAHYLLQDYEEVDRMARAYAYPKMPDALAVLHLYALIRQRRLDSLEDTYAQYVAAGLYGTSGQLTPNSQVLTFVCDQLYLSDQTEALNVYIDKLEVLTMQQQADDPAYYRNLGVIAFFRKQYDQALSHWQQERTKNQAWPGWLRQSLQIEHQSRIGYCAAMVEDSTLAESQLLAITAQPDSLNDIKGIKKGIKAYYTARIYAALGKPSRALRALQKAQNEGFSMFRPQVFRFDPFFKILHSHATFQQIIKAKD